MCVLRKASIGDRTMSETTSPYDRLRQQRRATRRSHALAALASADEVGRPLGARIRVFGSLATGTFREDSDIDLAVEAPDASLDEAIDAITKAIEEHGFPCDVVCLARASESLCQRIERDGRELSALG